MEKIDRILLVDDDNINNFLNARLIKKVNPSSEIKIANNGVEALAYLKDPTYRQKPTPPLIFLDIDMPIMNGMAFLNVFKENKTWNKKPVIIVLSSWVNNQEMDVLRESKLVSDYLIKPLTEEKVQAVVNKYLS